MTKELDSYDNDYGYIILTEGNNNTVDIEYADLDCAIAWDGVTEQELIDLAEFFVNAAAELRIRRELEV